LTLPGFSSTLQKDLLRRSFAKVPKKTAAIVVFIAFSQAFYFCFFKAVVIQRTDPPRERSAATLSHLAFLFSFLSILLFISTPLPNIKRFLNFFIAYLNYGSWLVRSVTVKKEVS